MESRRYKLIHPYVDEISVIWGEGTYSNWPETVEIAFIRDGKFYEEPIAPFEKEYEGQVYGHVDMEKLSQFLVVYEDKSALMNEVRQAISDAILEWHTPEDNRSHCCYGECTHIEDAAIARGEIEDE